MIFFEYIENVLGPVLSEYAKSRGMTIQDLLLEATTLENTGLFNYKNKENVVYNRLRNNGITNLLELFDLYDNNNLDYGKKEIKSNCNYYIHNEIDGIVILLKYKYLGIKSEKLGELLNYNINIATNDNHIKDEIYMVLKSCDFNQVSVNVLIDIIYEQKISNIA